MNNEYEQHADIIFKQLHPLDDPLEEPELMPMHGITQRARALQRGRSVEEINFAANTLHFRQQA